MGIFALMFLYAMLFFASYLCMSLRRKTLYLTYGRYECDPTLLVSVVCPMFGIIFALADIAAYKMGLREPGYYFNGDKCTIPQ